jgi:hypothetical protein
MSATERHLTDAQYKRLSQEQDTKARAHSNAEHLARALGSFAPDPAPSESSGSYRRRLAGDFQKYSKDWASVDLKMCAPDAFDKIEHAIYADAAREILEPTNVPPGELAERISTDQTGRRISRFFGDPEVCWGPFKQDTKVIIGYKR